MSLNVTRSLRGCVDVDARDDERDFVFISSTRYTSDFLYNCTFSSSFTMAS